MPSKATRTLDISWLRRYPLAAAVLAVVVVSNAPSNLVVFLLAAIALCAGIGFVSFRAAAASNANRSRHVSLQERFPRFRFLDSFSPEEDAPLEATNAEALFPDSFLISETLENIIDFILRDFIRSWFQKISADETFVRVLKQQFRTALKNLTERLGKVDISDLIVMRLIPILNDHFNNYVIAEEIVRSKKKSMNDFDFAVASNFNMGKLHPAVKSKNLAVEVDRKQYLADSIEAILPYILPKKELDSSPVNILLKHILTSCVVFPSLSMLWQADFWNQIIISSVGAALKDRYKVKQFRSVLDQNVMHRNDFYKNPLMKKIVNTKTSQAQYEKILKAVHRSNSIPELKQLRYYTGLQLSKSARHVSKETKVSEDVKLYNKRLQVLRSKIDSRVEYLLHHVSSAPDTSFKPDSLPKNSKLDLSLGEILGNPTSLTYFMEFMDQRNRTVLLQFWLTVNGIKSPLEDLSDYEDAESDDEELVAMSLSLDLSQSDDVEHIFQQYFSSRALKIDPANFAAVSAFVDAKAKTLDLYVRARKSLLVLQKETFERMEKTDFVAFKESDLFLRLLSTEDFLQESSHAYHNKTDANVHSDIEEEEGDPLANYDEVDETYDAEVGENVVKAVEDALNDIMIDDKQQTRPGSDLPSRNSSTSLIDSVVMDEKASTSILSESPSKLQREIFGLGSEPSLFDDFNSSSTNLAASDHLPKRQSRIFDDVSDSETEASDSESGSNFELNMQGAQTPDPNADEVQLAAPGDLNLAEEIEKLSVEIERFEKQLAIIDPLLKKAEITNNVAELKILRKSRAALEREIQLKELQKQQYIVQESDNSLYGKSRVRIQSYVPEKDFILYIIEVQKFSADNVNQVTAGWIVSRRFSQFHKLNEYLKSKYPKVRELAFPKKKVVMKFQQTSLIIERKDQLEAYLQQLIKIPEVCTNHLFRSFLSSEVFAMELNHSLDYSTKMSRRAKMENVANKLYSSLATKVPLSAGSLLYDRNGVKPQGMLSRPEQQASMASLEETKVTDMQNELNSFDEVGKVSFVKPICDLIISVFSLKKSNAWLRGKAILVVLQQLLGSTIEKKVRDNLQYLCTSETKILDMTVLLRDKLWPGGSFRESGKPRSTIEKSSTKAKSKVYLEKFLLDSTSRIFGTSNSKFASNKIHGMLQNEIILNNLIFSLYDEILQEVFPELNDN